MGCETSRQRKLALLKLLSRNTLDERQIENIMMNTYWNFNLVGEADLYILFKRFKQLDSSSEGKISNRQLMELNEFKHCPFKKFLPRALKLESDEIIVENEQNVIVRVSDKRNTILAKDDGDDDEEFDKKLINLRKQKEESKEDEDNKYINDNYVNSIDKGAKEIPTEKLLLNENKFDENDNLNRRLKSRTQDELENLKNNLNKEDNLKINSIENKYIDFAKFCDIMKIFNEKYPVDLKIRFYFKLFDVNGDGRISKDDLLNFLLEVFPDDLVNSEKLEKEKDNNNKNKTNNTSSSNKEAENNINFEKLIDIVFSEIVANDRRKYIDYDDFNTVMWTTNIDKSCSIDFVNQI